MELASDPKKGMRRWLLLRRSTDEPEEMGFYQAYGPEGTTVEELVRVCQERWAVEECFAEAKGEIGLEHYEVRKWDAWHRHITLCLLAHAFLAVVGSSVEREEGAGKRGGSRSRPDPADGARGETPGAGDGRAEGTKTLPLEVVLVEAGTPGGGGPVAVRCRRNQASRAKGRYAGRSLCGETPLQTTVIAPEEADLTDEQWALVRPLLPPQRSGTGRPPLDHRRMLGSILWVARTGSSWREMPEEYGKWESAYRRHELWVKQGLWQRILRVLGEKDLPGPSTKEPN